MATLTAYALALLWSLPLRKPSFWLNVASGVALAIWFSGLGSWVPNAERWLLALVVAANLFDELVIERLEGGGK